MWLVTCDRRGDVIARIKVKIVSREESQVLVAQSPMTQGSNHITHYRAHLATWIKPCEAAVGLLGFSGEEPRQHFPVFFFMESSESRVSFSTSVVSHMYVSNLNLPNFKQALPLCFRKSQICMGYTLLKFPVTVELSDSGFWEADSFQSEVVTVWLCCLEKPVHQASEDEEG